MGDVYYSFSQVVTSRRLTNLRSDWVEPGMDVGYSDSSAATTNASITGTATAEAGVIFAKASASIGVTVGKTWTRQRTWTYHAVNRSKTKEARLVMYHETRRFLVTKKRVIPPCKVQTLYRTTVNAPLTKSGDNVWRLQYRTPK